MWSYAATPSYLFLAWCLMKHRQIYLHIYILRKIAVEGTALMFCIQEVLGSNSTQKTAMLIIIRDFPPSLLKNTDLEAEY
jgi:hypothetical protein